VACTLSGWGPQRCAAAPTFSVQPGSAALGGAGLTAGLAVLVALAAGLLAVGLLPATGLLALPAWVADNPGVTIKEAAEHFGVTPAVIERDVNTLWVSGLPSGMHGDLVDFDAADFEAGRLRLSEPLGLDRPVRLTRQEAISLLMALRVLADLLADDEASAGP